ncbi:MAG: type I methionyl aminopeptidase [Oligoflexia bacterium]|nr:type I methionyl aminopeptidase [Oligoflexia bacterium]
MVTIKSGREIEAMRKAGKLAAHCLTDMLKLVKPGVTPLQIDRACYEWTKAHGAVPAPLHYHGFPASLCISVNDVVCHGIPGTRALKKGDLVNLDVTPILDGFHGDTNATTVVGAAKSSDMPPELSRLIETTHRSMWDGIRQVRPGSTLGDIGHAIQTRVEGAGYSVVLEYCGHGIGRAFHEDPTVSHVGKPGQGMKLREGMTFTIEPMVNMGERHIYVEEDGWTVRTSDGSLSAQFEHTILVTPTGFEVLTLREGESISE